MEGKASAAGSQVSGDVLKSIQAGYTAQLASLQPIVGLLMGQRPQPEAAAPVGEVGILALRIPEICRVMGVAKPCSEKGWVGGLDACDTAVWGKPQEGTLMDRAARLERQMGKMSTPGL